MTSYFVIAALYSGICIAGFMAMQKDKIKINTENIKKYLWVILLAGFAIRRWYGLQDVAFWFDVGCFKSWADATAYYGLNGMYHSGMFLDYPPGYMYMLWLSKIVQTVFGLDYNSVAYTFVIKLPPMLADLAGAYLIYKLSKENLDEKWALFLTACYTFCPALIYNSAVWGQIDSWYTLFMVLALYFISHDDVVKASVIYAIALITKPQALLFGPVLLFWVISKKSWKIFFTAVCTGLSCMYLLAVPFAQSFNPIWLVNLYKNTFNGYRYFTVNGYNAYMIADLNWKSLDSVAGAGSINTVVIALCFALCVWLYFSIKDKSKIFTTALILITVFFSFCTMMHERYMHPAILLALVAYIVSKNKFYFGLFLTATAANFLNVTASFVTQYNGVAITRPQYTFISLLAIATAVGAIALSVKTAIKDKAFQLTPIAKKWRPIALLCIFYGMFAFFRLGSTSAPQTFWQTSQSGEWFVYRFDKPATVSHIWTYSGMGDEYYPSENVTQKLGGEFEILAVNSSGLWGKVADIHHDYVFTWKKVDTDFYADSVMIRSKAENQVLNEIVFIDNEGQVIRGQVGSMYAEYQQYTPYHALDESHTMPSTGDDYYWSAYFDEIYHARTAYEQLNSYTIYETTHPPLGKTLISIGIALFGMTPFGWRCVGAACGVLMVLVMYLLAKELFGSEKTALFTAFVFAFDFMHYTQTRIATVDSYVVLFVMLMFLYMIRWAKIPLKDNSVSAYFNLLMSGLFMGCAVAVKWNGAYSAIGLAAYFFMALWIKYKDYATDRQNKDGIKKMAVICCWCVLFFVIVPAVIYFAAFAPVLYTDGVKRTLAAFIRKQLHMFSYHSQLVAEHFFASLWYTWPVIIKPIWYSVARFDGMTSSISAFGNPAVWLPMVPALGFMAYKCAKTKDKSSIAVIAGYLGSFLPWVAITRLTFIYHYFPATIFGVLAIGYVINQLLKTKNGTKAVYIYLATVFVLFIVFFPVISGLPASSAYLDSLELLSTWYFN